MKIKICVLTLICAFLLSACSVSTDEATETVFAMDTVMDLKAYGKNAQKALGAAREEISRLEAALSRGTEGSEIYSLNAQKSTEVSDETAAIIEKALEISASTDGAFDISIAPVMDSWGFFTKDFRVPTDEELTAALARVDYKNISAEGNNVALKSDAQIDLGGIAKGYLSAKIMEIFRENGVKSGIVSLGGNVQALGRKTDGSKWKVAVQNPNGGDFLGKLAVEDMAVITSGGYQRYFERDGVVYHHIIDPETGYPAKSGVKSVTIVSSDAAMADGLSTALYVMGLDKGTEYWRSHDNFEVVFMTDDNSIYITEGLKDIFTSEYDYSVIER